MYTSSLHIASGETTNEEKEKFVFSLNILGWSNRDMVESDINNAATYRSGTAI